MKLPNSLPELLETLQNPGSGYRPLPFWSWNDKLDVARLTEQARGMHEAGLGGFFMHARSGLETEYLGEEWMECVHACVEQAAQTGMQAWLYDENGWPSGFADGKVTALGDRCHGRWLKVATIGKASDAAELPGLLGVYCVDGAGAARMLGPSDADEPSGTLYAVQNCSNPFYIDVMSPEAVRAFLACPHGAYAQRFPADFNGRIAGFFTDEPRLSGDFEGNLPWSYGLPAAFREAYGYDIVPRLPCLFTACGGHEKVRYDFWRLVSRMFVGAYIVQISEWCKAHGCGLTGHMMMEESIFTQMTGNAGVMPL